MRLIILYGRPEKRPGRSGKTQKMILSQQACGYRPYAQHFGTMIYMEGGLKSSGEPWEVILPNPQDVIDFCSANPDSLVWSIKNDNKAKAHILDSIPNRKIYYSCGLKHGVNLRCHISLVDDPSRRVHQSCRLWVKGKDPEYWKPSGEERTFDYAVIGKSSRKGKNQDMFVRSMMGSIRTPRSIIWIGGGKRMSESNAGIHHLTVTPFAMSDTVCKWLSRAKVGVLFTTYRNEGFPQSFLEMAMCGVPIVYSNVGPGHDVYFQPHVAVRATKPDLPFAAERMLAAVDNEACRKEAIENFSIDKSYESLMEIANSIRL